MNPEGRARASETLGQIFPERRISNSTCFSRVQWGALRRFTHLHDETPSAPIRRRADKYVWLLVRRRSLPPLLQTMSRTRR